ncbi:hypothetical protein CBS101457_006416 [Exobasidium rhododendri]|nr:hypothetical protein CBS101457_006416 [Exobasidium rhododendri]
MSSNAVSSKAPVWFIAHGGPPTLFDKNHGAYQHWLKVVSDMKASNLKGIVFVSAHWQAEAGDFADRSLRQKPTSILMNINQSNPLIYDFYGFPKYYYETKLISKNPQELQDAVSTQLFKEGYHVEETDRGIDHGVWVPLRAAGERFDIPLVQISLPISKDPLSDGVAALRLGKALHGLRDSGYAVVGGGQPVHNLRGYMMSMQGYPSDNSFGKTFITALTQAVSLKPSSEEVKSSDDDPRWADAKALFARPDYHKAHPTSEHLLPVLVALGAAERSEDGVEEFALNEGAMAWSMYKFSSK